MIIKTLQDEDFVNYKLPSMFIAFPSCTFKCERECAECCCQNSALANSSDIDISVMAITERYMNNPITKALVFGGLEPFDSWEDMRALISDLRYYTPDDIVIYTGYTKDEIADKLPTLSLYENIVVKFGRYRPGQAPHYDEILGVNLASDNQFAERIEYENYSQPR